jgi:hypothetical protein
VRFSLAGFEVTLIGRFWVTPEAAYELLAAKRNDDGACPEKATEFQAVRNDYVLLLISAQKAGPRSGEVPSKTPEN